MKFGIINNKTGEARTSWEATRIRLTSEQGDTNRVQVLCDDQTVAFVTLEPGYSVGRLAEKEIPFLDLRYLNLTPDEKNPFRIKEIEERVEAFVKKFQAAPKYILVSYCGFNSYNSPYGTIEIRRWDSEVEHAG